MAQTIGERLRQIRGEKTQAEFADLLGIARKTLVRYEAGEREVDVDLILRLNLLFKVQPLWLLTGAFEPIAGTPLTVSSTELLSYYEQCAGEDQAIVRRIAAALAANRRDPGSSKSKSGKK